MCVEMDVRLNKRQADRYMRTLRTAPKKTRKDLDRRWNNSALVFRKLMQDKHLSGGTTKDRLARRSSTLYNSLRHEVKVTRFLIMLSVWFLDAVSDYAPTHEFGDPSRNIPARMNLRKEWAKFQKIFYGDAENAMEEGIK